MWEGQMKTLANRNLRHKVSFLGFPRWFPTWIIYFCVLSLAVLHSYIPYTVIYGKAMENDGKLWKTYVLCCAGWIWNTREQSAKNVCFCLVIVTCFISHLKCRSSSRLCWYRILGWILLDLFGLNFTDWEVLKAIEGMKTALKKARLLVWFFNQTGLERICLVSACQCM